MLTIFFLFMFETLTVTRLGVHVAVSLEEQSKSGARKWFSSMLSQSSFLMVKSCCVNKKIQNGSIMMMRKLAAVVTLQPWKSSLLRKSLARPTCWKTPLHIHDKHTKQVKRTYVVLKINKWKTSHLEMIEIGVSIRFTASTILCYFGCNNTEREPYQTNNAASRGVYVEFSLQMTRNLFCGSCVKSFSVRKYYSSTKERAIEER